MSKFYQIVENIKNYGNCQIYIGYNLPYGNLNYVITLYIDENGELAAYGDLVINDKAYFFDNRIDVDKTAVATTIDEHDFSKEDIALTIVKVFCYSRFGHTLISKNETNIKQCNNINPDKAIKQLYDIFSQMINLSLSELILLVKYPIAAKINLLSQKIKDGIIENDINEEEILANLDEKLTAFDCNFLKVLYAWEKMQNATNDEDYIKFEKEFEQVEEMAEYIDITKASLNNNQEIDSSLNQYYREYLEMIANAQSVEEFKIIRKSFELGMNYYKESLINPQQPSEKQITGSQKAIKKL